MKPRCANDVPLNERPPPSQVSPTSVCGDERELAVAVQRALGQSGRARREDDRDRPVGIVGERGRRFAADAQTRRAPCRARRRRGTRRRRGRRARPATSSTASRSRCRQPVVHARGDRAELGRRAVREQVLGPGRQHERDDVAGARRRARPSPTATSSEIRSTSGYDSAQPRGATYAVRSAKRRAASAIVRGSIRERQAEAYKSPSRRAGASRMTSAVATRRARPARRRATCGRRVARRCASCSTRAMRVFAERGFQAARVDDIVRAARTSHGTFYLYFANKEDLLRALAVECAHEMDALADGLGAITPDDDGPRRAAPVPRGVLLDVPPLRAGDPRVDGRQRRRPRGDEPRCARVHRHRDRARAPHARGGRAVRPRPRSRR